MLVVNEHPGESPSQPLLAAVVTIFNPADGKSYPLPTAANATPCPLQVCATALRVRSGM